MHNRRTENYIINDYYYLQQLDRSLVDDQLNQHCQDLRPFREGGRLAIQGVGLSMIRLISTASFILDYMVEKMLHNTELVILLAFQSIII